jgi:hypothetical protein
MFSDNQGSGELNREFFLPIKGHPDTVSGIKIFIDELQSGKLRDSLLWIQAKP